MEWYIGAILFAVCGTISSALAVRYALLGRFVTKYWYASLLMAGSALSIYANLGELLSKSLQVKLFWDWSEYIGLTILPHSFLIYAGYYTGIRKRPKLGFTLVLLLVLASILLITFGRPLLWDYYDPGLGHEIEKEYHPLYYAFVSYFVVMAIVGGIVILIKMRRTSTVFF